MDEHTWLPKRKEILSDIKKWRRAHPKATLVESADEVQKRMMQLEAQMLLVTVQESSSRVWGGPLGQEHARCPKCEDLLKARGKHKRTGPRQWRAKRHLAGVRVSEETARRLTEQAGAGVAVAQTAQAKTPVQEELHTKAVPARLAISADGACVPLPKGEWEEVRTVAMEEVEERCTTDGEKEIHVGQLSYFSRLRDADLAEVEMRHRQVIQAEQVCAVTDGVHWLQGFIDLHRSDAVRILDFPNAAEHLSNLLEAVEKMGHRFPAQMLERCLHVLKHRGPRPLLL